MNNTEILFKQKTKTVREIISKIQVITEKAQISIKLIIN